MERSSVTLHTTAASGTMAASRRAWALAGRGLGGLPPLSLANSSLPPAIGRGEQGVHAGRMACSATGHACATGRKKERTSVG